MIAWDIPERYRSFYQGCIAAGLPLADVLRAVDEMARTDAALDARTCPRCARDVTARCDPRQAGESSVKGAWFIYHCRACGYLCNRVESDRTKAP